MNTEKETRVKRPEMVDWYAPFQLVKTGAQTFFTTLLGGMIDNRRIIAVEDASAAEIPDFSENDQFCFDYMADTGDGWNSTFSMAVLLTSPELNVGGRTLERADLVVLGGDEVYPVASKEAYAERFVSPFNQAGRSIRARLNLKSLPQRPLFMVPGNHDWYDSLGSFSRRFFGYHDGASTQSRDIGQFKTSQGRSYFALKLPHDWQLWALDIQLGEDIDNQQFVFFRKCARSIGPQTNIILCTAAPIIVSGRQVQGQSLDFSIDRITRLAFDKGAKVPVHLAGDVHNYQRYQVEEDTRGNGTGDRVKYKRHHIVSGGGGAFLHPTHAFPGGTSERPAAKPCKLYPEPEVSKRLSHRLLAFAITHPPMAALIGGLYLSFFWQTGTHVNFWGIPLLHPLSLLLILTAVAGCVAFAGTDSVGKTLWGALHGVGHLFMAVASWRLGEALTETLGGSLGLDGVIAAYCLRLTTFVVGSLLGGTLFGVYLWCSLNLFRLHHNEAFSALCWPHHKNFLRCYVQSDGTLKILAIGVERTASEEGSHPVATHLIEEITVAPNQPETTGSGDS